MDSGRPPRPKEYYNNIEDGHLYRVDAYGFDVDTGIERVILRDINNGRHWDMPKSRLQDVKLIDKVPVKIWEPNPSYYKETPYSGYTNDPRKEDPYDDLNLAQRHPNRAPSIDNLSRKYTSSSRR